MRIRFVRALSCLLACLVALGSESALAAETPVVSSIEDVRADAKNVPCGDDRARLDAVRNLFVCMGAAEKDVVVEHFKNVDNVVVRVPGKGPGYVVVGAHYDKTAAGCGAIDNWTGIVILAHLYRTLRATNPTKTLVFVAFGKEEGGLIGSKAMVGAIPKDELPSYCSMVNVDSFGLANPQIMENATTGKLTPFVRAIAEENKLDLTTARIPGGDADSSSFKNKGVPAVTLHGMTNEWPEILHSAKDQAGLVDARSVYLGYRFALIVVHRLDACDCAEFR